MLKRLEIQGFKTFAQRTTFDLEGGITAIVGPNGSGKSNLAEAVRWVLGEQSLRQIRSRKTEDVIYAGGANRPPAGMAEVVVTLDNSAGHLALPFAEVSITRRAYRSGENEYLVNGERARLRDISDLLSRAGLSSNNHVVVGQGLVDAALSLRPAERRALFEDAAAITHHQERLAEARDKLGQTESNLIRALDIAAEIEPRLPGLARLAERAQQALALRAELDELLVDYYDGRWREAQTRAATLAASHAESMHAAGAYQRALAEAEQCQARLEDTRRAVATDLAEKRRLAGEERLRAESLRRELAATIERLAGLAARAEEATRDLAELRHAAEVEETGQVAGRQVIIEIEERRSALATRLAAADTAAADRQRQAQTTRASLRAAETRLTAAGDALAEARARHRSAQERRASLEGRQSELEQERAKQTPTDESATNRRSQSEEDLRLVTTEQESISGAREHSDEQLAAIRAQQQRLAAEAAALDHQIKQADARRDLLASWRDSRSGYYSGVQAVLQASRGRPDSREPRVASPRLGGVLGPVGELIQSPADLEVAIEVALGGHLQDVVVERWADAEAAIELLKRTGAGRATFLPLDTIRSTGPGRGAVDGAGIHGVASQLVSYDPRLASVVESLLGHTLVVDDLAVARRTLRQVTGAWQIVTLGGEIVRSSGAVTGGSSVGAGRGLLSRERELRQLPSQAAALQARLDRLNESLAATRRDEAAAVAELARLRKRDQELAGLRRSGEALLAAARREEASFEAARRWRAEEAGRVATELARMAAEASTQAAAATRAELVVGGASAEVEGRRTALAATEVEDHRAAIQTAEARAERNTLEAEARAARDAQARRALALIRLGEQITSRANRFAEIAPTRAELERRLAADSADLTEAEASGARVSAEIAPREVRAAEIERSLTLQTLEARTAADRLRSAQNRERQAAIEVERQRVEMAGILRQIEADLGPTEQALIEADKPRSTTAGIEEGDIGFARVIVGGRAIVLGRSATAGESSQLPIADSANRSDSTRAEARGIYLAGLTARIAELRRRLRGLGSAGPEAIAEHEQALTRHTFLTGQVKDLQRAAETLRQAIADLEQQMHARFLTTFAAVGQAFERNFGRLFGGGSGELALTSPDDPEGTGVDITVQLPGKRARNLAQLSGGERALTAVALIFALLEVNPTPFCVFDEVDAALDEANIGRFAELLRERSNLTQFLIITHNRRTMEAAGCLYGLSMEQKSVSRAFSLRLGDA